MQVRCLEAKTIYGLLAVSFTVGRGTREADGTTGVSNPSNFDSDLMVSWQLFNEWPGPGKEVDHAEERFLIRVPKLIQQRPYLLA